MKNLLAFSCSQKTIERYDVGVARGTVFQKIRPGAGFKTGGFVKERLGGLYRRMTLRLP